MASWTLSCLYLHYGARQGECAVLISSSIQTGKPRHRNRGPEWTRGEASTLPRIYLATSTQFPEKLTEATSLITVETSSPHKSSKRPSEGAIHSGPGDASLPGRRAPHWADCACRDPVQAAWLLAAAAPWTIPRRNLVFLCLLSRPGDELLPQRRLSTALVFLTPWCCPTVRREAVNQASRPVAPGKAWTRLHSSARLAASRRWGD